MLLAEGDRYAIRAAASHSGIPLRAGLPVVIEGAERLWPMRPVMEGQ